MDPLTRLAQAARSGDPQALEAFVQAAYEQVERFCAYLVDEGSADDLAQETFIRALRSLPNYRGESSARTWLLSIGRRTCCDELRARARQRRQDGAAFAAAREPATVPDASQAASVSDLLGRLDPNRRAAFVVTQVMGLSYAEAATVCGCPTGTIRSRVARARTDLLGFLGPRTTVPRGGEPSSRISSA